MDKDTVVRLDYPLELFLKHSRESLEETVTALVASGAWTGLEEEERLFRAGYSHGVRAALVLLALHGNVRLKP